MENPQVLETLSGYWPGAAQAQGVIDVSLSTAYRGGRRLVDQGGRSVSIVIPAGIHTGAKIYLPARGGSQRATEFFAVVVVDEPPFRRCGDDLQLEFTIDAFTAILGGVAPVPTLLGPITLLNVPPGTGPGSTLRLAGLGMPILGRPQFHGDLCVHLRVVIPETATELERKLIDDSAWLRGWRLGHHDGAEARSRLTGRA